MPQTPPVNFDRDRRSPLTVAFDGRALGSPAGGVRRYATELFAALAERSDVRVVGVGASTVVPAGVTPVPAAWSFPTNLGWAVSGLPLSARKATYDVFHAPAYTAPLVGCRPLVVSIHDVSYARRPEFYPYRRDPARRAFYQASARRADRIVTCSSFSRDEIAAAYAIDPARIDVVPLAAGSRFKPQPRTARERVVLHVGELHPRRNLRVLVEAFGELRRMGSRWSDLRLVIAGVDRGELESIRARASQLQLTDALQYVGAPTDEALVDWYNRAGVFAYPSCYEGFGLPVLEAMACGAPVIASAAASIPEVAGDAAMLVATDDVRGWRDALVAVLDGSENAGSLRTKGFRRAAAFSWSRTAADTLSAYRRTIREHHERARGRA